MLRAAALRALVALGAGLATGATAACEGEMFALGDGAPASPGVDARVPDDGAAAPTCVERVTGVPTGTHLPGSACQGCHGPTGTAPRFTLAGTLFTAASGGTGLAEGTITVTDASGATRALATAQNGNFWTTEALVYPVRVHASLCPDAVTMTAEVTAPGDCNGGGCHGSASQVHLLR